MNDLPELAIIDTERTPDKEEPKGDSMKKGKIGTVINGTMRNEDLIPDLMAELEWMDEEGNYKALIQTADKITDFDSEAASEILNEMIEAMQVFAPPYFYFGAHPGDGADYGYWLSECMSEDFDGLKVSDLSEVPADYNGEVLNLNDHGNMTLYTSENGKLAEVWGIV